jgi:mannose-1-phosphate guanylyltransferase
MSGTSRVVPVILSGGSGTRLWPVSRPERPKQLLSLTADETMLQLTVARVSAGRFAPPIIVANASHADVIERQLEEVGIVSAQLVLEPTGRNTAPAIALAAIAAGAGADPILVMPSDHVIADVASFHAAIDTALPLAHDGWLITFGIAPDAPETGYGYIKVGHALSPGAHEVDAFIEKPARDKAEVLVAAGDHVWNGGIFLFRADAYLSALRALEPEMLGAVEKAMEKSIRAGQRILPDAHAFSEAPSNSIDYAVMERASRVAVVPVAMGWSDVGCWDALHAISEIDEGGNVIRGDVVAIDARNCLIRAEPGRRVALVGASDLIVVAAGDDVIILPRGQSQEIKKIIEALKQRTS